MTHFRYCDTKRKLVVRIRDSFETRRGTTQEKINLFPSSVRDIGGGLYFTKVRINVLLCLSMTIGFFNFSDC